MKDSELAMTSKPEQNFALTCFSIRDGFRRPELATVMAEAALRFAEEKESAAAEVCTVAVGRLLIWGDTVVGIAAYRAPRRPAMRKMFRA